MIIFAIISILIIGIIFYGFYRYLIFIKRKKTYNKLVEMENIKNDNWLCIIMYNF